MLVNINEHDTTTPEDVGGKAYNLSRLANKGFNIPKSYAISSSLFDFLRDSLHLETDLEKLSWENIDDISKNLCAVFSQAVVKDALYAPINELHLEESANTGEYCVARWVTRSSATLEDSALNSFAGQFDSVLNLEFSASNLIDGIIKVYQSTYSVRALLYCLAKGIPPQTLSMAVIVQQMIQPLYAGTLFTKDIEEHNDRSCYIEATNGLGEGVVNGSAPITRYKYNKEKRFTQITAGSALLSDAHIQTLIDTGLHIEEAFGVPQDIEWAIDNKGLWILQTRPIVI